MTSKEKVDDLEKCRIDPIHYIFNRVYTFDENIQSRRLFGSGYPTEYQNKLKEFILAIIDVVKKGRRNVRLPDFHVLKSRRTGLTWTVAATIAYCFLFLDNFSAILTSQSDNKLDNANYVDTNTFLGKINYIINNTEPYLQPDAKDILRSSKNYQYILPNNSIKADSGTSPGRSGAYSLHAGDEWAEQEFCDLKLASLRESVFGPQLLFSTPKGHNNHYIIWKNGQDHPEQSSFNFYTFHWKEKMEKEEWNRFSESKLREYNGDIGMYNRNLELSWERLVIGHKVFNNFNPSHILKYTNESDKKIKDKLYEEIINGNIVISLDFGYYAPAVLISKSPTRSIIFGCILGLGKHPDLHSKMIIDELNKWGLKLDKTKVWGDVSGVSKPREQTGMSSFDLYRKALNNKTINRANNRVMEGIQTINGELFNNRLCVLEGIDLVTDALDQAIYPTDEANNPTEDKYIYSTGEHPLTDVMDATRYGIVQSGKIDPNRKEDFYVDNAGYGIGNVFTDNNIEE